MKRLASDIVLLVLGFCGSLLALDVYLQSAEIQTPMETRIDHEVGPAYVPGCRVTRFNEGFYIGGVNDLGYYGPARPQHAAAGEKRILMLGDSFVMGITLFTRYHFGTLLEEGLNEDFADSVEVLNFGRADFNFWNMYQNYRDFASHWDHDLVLFFVSEPDIRPTNQIEKDLYPFCYLDGDSLRIDYSFRESKKLALYTRMAPLVNGSALFRMIYNARKVIYRGELNEVVLDKFAFLVEKEIPPPPSVASVGEPEIHLPPVTCAILDELRRDPRVVLVVSKTIRAPLRQELESYGIPVIDVAAVLDEMEAAGIDPNYWPVTGKRGHWNHAAHGRIAEALREALKPALARQGVR